MDVSMDGEWMGTCSGYRKVYEDDELVGIELVEFKSVDEVKEQKRWRNESQNKVNLK